MNSKKFLVLAGLLVLLLGSAGTAWAVEDVCRACHGVSVADMHHVEATECTSCHPGGAVTRDCTASGCHNLGDLPPYCLACYTPESVVPTPPDIVSCCSIVTLKNQEGCFGEKQDTLDGGDGYDGTYRVILLAASHTFVPLNIKKWSNTKVKFKMDEFFEDNNDNYLQDPSEGTVPHACQWPGTWMVYIKYIYYLDDDVSGNYTVGDTIVSTDQSDYGPQIEVDFGAPPHINSATPKEIPRNSKLTLNGYCFGVEGSHEVRMGVKSKWEDPTLGQGRLLDDIATWDNYKIKVWLDVPQRWENKYRRVWVERPDPENPGMAIKSNNKKVKILPE
jgi:hypothetical protein